MSLERLTFNHVWLGASNIPESQFEDYFKLDYETDDINDPSYKVCPFCIETGMRWYDEDLLVRIFFDQPLPIEQVLQELPSDKIRSAVFEQCKQLNISEANILYYYSDVDINSDNFSKSSLGVQYLGCFDYD